MSRGCSLGGCGGFSRRSVDSRCEGSVVEAHWLRFSMAYGVFPDQGLNPCPLTGSQILRHWAPKKSLLCCPSPRMGRTPVPMLDGVSFVDSDPCNLLTGQASDSPYSIDSGQGLRDSESWRGPRSRSWEVAGLRLTPGIRLALALGPGPSPAAASCLLPPPHPALRALGQALSVLLTSVPPAPGTGLGTRHLLAVDYLSVDKGHEAHVSRSP